MHAHQFWWVWSFWFRRYCHLQKLPNFPFQPWTIIVHGHQKIQSIEISSKKSCKYNLMSNACKPILVDMPSPVSEILLPSTTAKFPSPTMDYSPWSSDNSIDRNWLNKFMQVEIDVKCMHINFGGYAHSGFRDIATFKNGQISLSDYGHQKIQSIGIGSKKSCKYNLMSNACTLILVGMAILVSEILLPSKTAKFSFLTMDYSPWSTKNSIDRNQLKKIMQVQPDAKCMHTNFDGCTFSSFGDIATFINGQISISDHGL